MTHDMTPERWRQVKAVVQALELHGEADFMSLRDMPDFKELVRVKG
jgi:hypothetical protein